jgi:hypothetical protein
MKNKILFGIFSIVVIALIITTVLTVMLFFNQRDLKDITERIEIKDPIVRYEEENKIESTAGRIIKIEQEVSRRNYIDDECFVTTKVNVYVNDNFENIEWYKLDTCECSDVDELKKKQYKQSLPTVKKLKEVFKKYAKNK